MQVAETFTSEFSVAMLQAENEFGDGRDDGDDGGEDAMQGVDEEGRRILEEMYATLSFFLSRAPCVIEILTIDRQRTNGRPAHNRQTRHNRNRNRHL
jgi:hypothetical protein